MRQEATKILRAFFIAAFFITLFQLFSTEAGAQAAFDEQIEGEVPLLCLSSKETAVNLRLNILENGFVSGDFCIEGCDCGTILGEAHIAEVDGTRYGTIDLYADLPEVCAYGLWYSIDLPSLSHIWYYTGLTSTRYRGTGEFEEIPCNSTR